MEINKVKMVNVPIKVWTDKDFVYFNSAEAVKYVWGSTTASCDMRRQGLERVTDKRNNLLHYRLPKVGLNKRLLDLKSKFERIKNGISVIESVLKNDEVKR